MLACTVGSPTQIVLRCMSPGSGVLGSDANVTPQSGQVNTYKMGSTKARQGKASANAA